MNFLRIRTVQDGEDCVPRVDVEASDPRLPQILQNFGVTVEEFQKMEQQTVFLQNLMAPGTSRDTTHDVKKDMERLLGCDPETCTFPRGKQLEIAKTGDFNAVPHVHFGETSLSADDCAWYNNGIVVDKLNDQTLVVNTFTFWSGYTWIDHAWTFDIPTWTCTSFGYNGFAHGLICEDPMEGGVDSFHEFVSEANHQLQTEWANRFDTANRMYKMAPDGEGKASLVDINNHTAVWSFNHSKKDVQASS